MYSSKKIEECVQQPLEFMGIFHFGIGPIINSTTILLRAIFGGFDFGEYEEYEGYLNLMILIRIIWVFLFDLFIGWLWTKLISKSITSQQPIHPMYLFMMSILYLFRVFAPIYWMLDSKFDMDIIHRKRNTLHNQIQEQNQIVELADKMKKFDHKLGYIDSLIEDYEANTTLFIINMIAYFESSILVTISLYQLYKIAQYYKISTPAQNVNNMFKNKGGRNVTTREKKPPQKSTIGKR